MLVFKSLGHQILDIARTSLRLLAVINRGNLFDARVYMQELFMELMRLLDTR